MTRNLWLGTAAALLAVPAFSQQQDFSAAHIETQRLTPNLHMLILIGEGAGNIALSTGADGSVLVDTQFAPLNAKILAAVRSAGGSDVKYVINTHWHGEQTGGNVATRRRRRHHRRARQRAQAAVDGAVPGHLQRAHPAAPPAA